MQMKNRKKWKINRTSHLFLTLVLVFIFTGLTSNAFGFFGFGNTASWKEEVLLHDGSKIVVERWQKRGGRHELGQRLGIAEHSITFRLPRTKQVVKWKDEYSVDVGSSSLELLALDIINGTAYIVSKPVGMIAYNKWDRPNPPYVIFKFTGEDWKRINMPELPSEFRDVNLVIDTLDHEEDLVRQGVISAERVKEFNSSLTQEEYKTIIHKPLKPGSPGISEPVMIRIKDGWESPDGGRAPIPIIPYGTKEKK
jgi:hypothetical protein